MTVTVKRKNRELVQKINLESKGDELLLGSFASPLIRTTTTLTSKNLVDTDSRSVLYLFCVEPSPPFYLKEPLVLLLRDLYSLIANCNCPGLLYLPS